MSARNPPALLPSATIPIAPSRDRVDWLDSARGAAIVLVVLLHSHATAVLLDGEIGTFITELNRVLRQVRMPLFYFCSGVLAYWGLGKPWSVVFRKRVLVLCWVIFLWTIIYFALQPFVNANAWSTPHRASQLFIVPFGVLWFLYAILIMSIVMRAVRPLGLPWQIISILALNGLVLVARKTFDMGGYDYLTDNLSHYAIAFFSAGSWIAPFALRMLDSRAQVVSLTILALVILVIDIALSTFVPLYDAVPVTLRSIPDVFFGVTFAALLARWQPIRAVFVWLGTRTLEIFLFHPIFIGLTLLAIQPFGLHAGRALPLIFVGALAGSILAERIAAAAGLRWLFRLPDWLTRAEPKPALAPAILHETPAG